MPSDVHALAREGQARLLTQALSENPGVINEKDAVGIIGSSTTFRQLTRPGRMEERRSPMQQLLDHMRLCKRSCSIIPISMSETR